MNSNIDGRKRAKRDEMEKRQFLLVAAIAASWSIIAKGSVPFKIENRSGRFWYPHPAMGGILETYESRNEESKYNRQLCM